eukprot:2124987-Rhodomonas_salina.1
MTKGLCSIGFAEGTAESTPLQSASPCSLYHECGSFHLISHRPAGPSQRDHPASRATAESKAFPRVRGPLCTAE